jgi:hypothetical protein
VRLPHRSAEYEEERPAVYRQITDRNIKRFFEVSAMLRRRTDHQGEQAGELRRGPPDLNGHLRRDWQAWPALATPGQLGGDTAGTQHHARPPARPARRHGGIQASAGHPAPSITDTLNESAASATIRW